MNSLGTILEMAEKLKGNKKYLAVLIVFIFVLYFLQDDTDSNVRNEVTYYSKAPHEKVLPQIRSAKFLINTTNCRIPDMDPFSEDVMQFVHREEYASSCINPEVLTYIDKKFGMATLNINTKLLPHYSSFPITCCYSEIRHPEGNDNEIRFGPCKVLKKSVTLNHPFIKVTCRNKFFMKVYENVHATTLLNNVEHAKGNSTYSVLLLGLGSMSKQNLRRTMQKTHAYLEKHFLNLKGYNAIDKDTYPNLMAILTGLSKSQLEEYCPFSIDNKDNHDKFLSDCNFIWKQFHRAGYVTAFGEDATPMSTSNYAKNEFLDSPTDYYYRPYFLAAEQISSITGVCHNKLSSLPETSAERVLDCAQDFSVTLKEQPSFGLFWINSFSYENINFLSSIDDKIFQFITDPNFVNSLNHTILVLHSDHGYRYGGIRQTTSGWLEERLPFIYLRIPSEFQKRYPREFKSVIINSERLTTPYDLHKMLTHVLILDSHDHNSLSSDSFQSLFKEIPKNRTCEEAGVTQEWCACSSYHNLPITYPFIENIAPFLIEEVNYFVDSFPEGKQCLDYSFENVHSSGISEVRIGRNNEKFKNILLMVKAKPKDMFEAVVEVNVEFPHNFKIVGNVSRINWYEDTISCVKNPELKKYCYCGGIMATLKNTICSTINIFCY